MVERGAQDAASPWRRAPARPAGKAAVSPERISDLIGEIYDCVLDPKHWEATLERARQELSFVNAVLGVAPLRPGAQIINATVGVAPEWLARVGQYQTEIAELWGGPERMWRYPLDEPIVHSQTAGFVGRDKNRYFREWCEPQGIIDSVGVAIAREPSLVGYLSFGRHWSAGGIGEDELSALRLLAPHVRRAVTISNLFDMKAIEAATFSSALDVLSAAVLLVDESLGIVHANAAGAAMLSSEGPIRSQKGTVALPTKAASDALQAAVDRSARDVATLGQQGIGIPAHGGTGEPRVVHVLPLGKGELRRGLAQRAAAALFIAPASVPSRMPIDALALLYDLTPAESRVFEMVCEGVTQEDIALQLGIARSTAKTHLLHVFEKTGCSRQVDLVKLAASLSLPA